MRALVVALFITQGQFALRHIPGNILKGYDAVDIAVTLAIVLGTGIVLALLYLRTHNLFIVIGAHALIDAPTPLFASPLDPYTLSLVFAVLALIAWPVVTQLGLKRHREMVAAPSH